MNTTIRKGALTYRIGGSWGNHIHWSKPEQFKESLHSPRSDFEVYGHKPIIPKEGDILEGKLKKGLARFVFSEVKRHFDPPDMFSATVLFVGYVHQLERKRNEQ